MDSEPSVGDNPFDVAFPSGKFFVGRETQLTEFRNQLRSLASGRASNLYLVGKGGTGKTSCLERIAEEAKTAGMLSFRCHVDIGKSAEINIDTIIRNLLREFQDFTGQKGIEDAWIDKKPPFRVPRQGDLRIDDLVEDLNYICNLMKETKKFKYNACVICIDEGQRIHPITLTVLKNAMQKANKCFIIVLSLLNETDFSDEEAGKKMLKDLGDVVRDPGASRFFPKGLSIGAFASKEEAEDCIKKD